MESKRTMFLIFGMISLLVGIGCSIFTGLIATDNTYDVTGIRGLIALFFGAGAVFFFVLAAVLLVRLITAKKYQFLVGIINCICGVIFYLYGMGLLLAFVDLIKIRSSLDGTIIAGVASFLLFFFGFNLTRRGDKGIQKRKSMTPNC